MNLSAAQKTLLAAALVGGTIFLRVMPHIYNFSAMDALALFAVTFFGRRLSAFALVIAARMACDILLAAISGQWDYAFDSAASTYGSLILITFMGYALTRRVTFGRTVPLAVAASLVFFLLSNFESWIALNRYTKDWNGLIDCYEAGLPFYRPTLISDVAFSVLFCALAQALAADTERGPAEVPNRY